MKTYIFLGVDWDAKPDVRLASNTEMMFVNTVKIDTMFETVSTPAHGNFV